MNAETVPHPPGQSYVIRCKSVFVGVENSSRVATLARARRFTREEAEEKIAQLTGHGGFVLPWQMQPVSNEKTGQR